MEARSRTLIMGIVNVTPDSFSDGGQYLDTDSAVAHALALVEEGADWLDVGGESTRPGAKPVSAEEESRRVVPVIAEIARAWPDLTLSVDTSKPEVARAALAAGATIVNDVTGLADPRMLPVVSGYGVVVMHMRGTPRTMQDDTRYDDIVEEVARCLEERVRRARAAGAADVWVDPGVGFGKALEDNPRLIRAVPRFSRIAPVLIGASRKRFIGHLTGVQEPTHRVAGSIGAALAAAEMGAAVVRVHDVAATRHALLVYRACCASRKLVEEEVD